LCERALIERKPALRIIGRLATILEDEIDNPASRGLFWHDGRLKLGKLRRLTQRDVWAIEIMNPESGANTGSDRSPERASGPRPASAVAADASRAVIAAAERAAGEFFRA
jgi:hypothetical protein